MDPFPGAYPQSEPPTPDVNTQQNQYPYQQDSRDARYPSTTSGVGGLAGQGGVGAQQPEHRYNEPKSQAISAFESGEVQSHRDDTFHAHPTQSSSRSDQLQTAQPDAHRYSEPRSEAVPAVLAAQVQAHKDDAATHATSAQPYEQRGLDQQSNRSEQPSVRRYDAPRSEAVPAVLAAQVQAHRDDAAPHDTQRLANEHLGQGSQSNQPEQPSVHRYDAPRSKAVPAVLAAQVQAHRDDASHGEHKQSSGQLGRRDDTASAGQLDVHRYDQPKSQAIPAVLAAEVQSHRDDGAHSSSTQPAAQQGHETRLDHAQQQAQSQPQQQGQGWPLRQDRLEQQHHESHSRESHHGHGGDRADDDKDTPYWGSLPTAAQGGIYNSVTGHGSSKDDHDQHHGLPERNRKQEDDASGLATHRSTSTSTSSQHEHSRGTGAGVAGTGIYNTVIGHGSQDEHAKQHSSSILAGTNPSTTNASAHYQSDEHARQQALQGAPRDTTSNSSGLASAQRSGMQQQDTSSSTYSPSSTYSNQHQDTSTDSHHGRNAAVGAGVGAAAVAAGSHALHEHRSSEAADTNRPTGAYNTAQTPSQTYDQSSSGLGSTHGGAPNISAGGPAALAAARSTQSDHSTQRAFPLTSSAGHEHKHADDRHQAGQVPVTHRTHETTTTTTTHEPRRQHEHQHFTHQTNTSPSPDAGTSRSRSGSKSEKQHHGLLGVFSSKHRDDSSSHPKVAEDERGHRKLVKDPPADIAPAVIAARQASVHRKRDSTDRGLENRHDVGATSSLPPTTESQGQYQSQSPSHPHSLGHNDRHETETLKKETESRHGMASGGLFHSKPSEHNDRRTDTSRDRHEAEVLKKETESRHGMGAGGLFHNKPTDHNDRTTTESRSYKDSDPSRTVHPSAVAGGSDHREASRQQDDSQHGHHGQALGTGAGVAAGGLAASELARRHKDDSSSQTQPGTAGTGTTGTTGTSNNHHAGAGTMSTAHSSSPLTDPSLPKTFSNTHNTVTGDALPYNTLASGTPSGVAVGSRAHGDHAQGAQRGTGQLKSSPTTHESRDTVTQATQAGSNDDFESKVGRNLAAGAGTGAAAAVGSRALQGHQHQTRDESSQVPSTTTHGDRGDLTPSTTTHGARDNLTSHTTTGSTDRYGQDGRSDQSHIGRDVGGGAGAGAAAYAGSRAIHDRHQPSSEMNTRGETLGDPLFTQPAHRVAQAGPRETPASTTTTQSVHHSGPTTTSPSGKDHGYDQLASGTPSGVSHGLTGSDNSHGSPQAGQYGSAERYPESHDNRAAGLAAGAGAGAAAYAGSRALHGQHASDNTTSTDADRYTTPGLAGQDASRYIGTASTHDSNAERNTSAPHHHLTSGAPSREAHESSTVQDPLHTNKTSLLTRETHAAEGARETAGQSDGYGHLAGGTASGLAAGAAGAAASHHTGAGSHVTPDTSRATQGAHASTGTSGSSELPPQYNLLPSGTPSGVNIEYKRMSKELSRDS